MSNRSSPGARRADADAQADRAGLDVVGATRFDLGMTEELTRAGRSGDAQCA
jgi:hypothetical protein